MTADATLLQMKYARIISLLAKKANIDKMCLLKQNVYAFGAKFKADYARKLLKLR